MSAVTRHPDEERRVLGAVRLQTRAKDGDATPVIVGHAALFNERSEDLGGFREVIAPGAFVDAIKADDVRALLNHDANYVLGRNRSGTLSLTEDTRGLAVEIEPPDTQWANDLMRSMERGDITQMSFAFSVRPNGSNWAKDDDGTVIRTLTKVRLFDVSVVTYPAYTATDASVGQRAARAWLDEANAELHALIQRDLNYRRMRIRLAEAAL